MIYMLKPKHEMQCMSANLIAGIKAHIGFNIF